MLRTAWEVAELFDQPFSGTALALLVKRGLLRPPIKLKTYVQPPHKPPEADPVETTVYLFDGDHVREIEALLEKPAKDTTDGATPYSEKTHHALESFAVAEERLGQLDKLIPGVTESFMFAKRRTIGLRVFGWVRHLFGFEGKLTGREVMTVSFQIAEAGANIRDRLVQVVAPRIHRSEGSPHADKTLACWIQFAPLLGWGRFDWELEFVEALMKADPALATEKTTPAVARLDEGRNAYAALKERVLEYLGQNDPEHRIKHKLVENEIISEILPVLKNARAREKARAWRYLKALAKTAKVELPDSGTTSNKP